ncbi:Hypothetical protein A7982_06749 [Minicystis rosea]|nr:Hypothetical protein A7982_06749 [Minicystis rosea]
MHPRRDLPEAATRRGATFGVIGRRRHVCFFVERAPHAVCPGRDEHGEEIAFRHRILICGRSSVQELLPQFVGQMPVELEGDVRLRDELEALLSSRGKASAMNRT